MFKRLVVVQIMALLLAVVAVPAACVAQCTQTNCQQHAEATCHHSQHQSQKVRVSCSEPILLDKVSDSASVEHAIVRTSCLQPSISPLPGRCVSALNSVENRHFYGPPLNILRI